MEHFWVNNSIPTVKGQKPKSNLPVQEIDNTATVTC